MYPGCLYITVISECVNNAMVHICLTVRTHASVLIKENKSPPFISKEARKGGKGKQRGVPHHPSPLFAQCACTEKNMKYGN